jgi:FkbM family methyltransferase
MILASTLQRRNLIFKKLLFIAAAGVGFLVLAQRIPSTFSTYLLSFDTAFDIAPILDCSSIQPLESGKLLTTSTVPSFQMQIHDTDKDRFVSKDIEEKGCFECDILQAAMNALKSTPDSVLVDIGGNIGLYSLTAAAMGRQSYTFEPAKVNYGRICQSIAANPGFEQRMTIVNRAVTSESMVVQFDTKDAGGNFGGLRFTRHQSGSERDDHELVEGVDYANGVMLDSLIGNPLLTSKPVVLKVVSKSYVCFAVCCVCCVAYVV